MTAPRPIASLAAVIAVAALLAPGTASADPASAEALFREGRRLLEEGKTDEACLTLAQSLAQDPSSGTLLNLGLCHEVQHRLATAWFDYVATAQLARDQGRPDRAAVAEKKATEIAPRLPYLTVTAMAPVPGLQIARGDQRLAPGVLGSAVPLDPGSYVVTASAPGYRAWSTTVDVAEAESKKVQVPELEPEGAPPAAAPVPVPAPPAIAPVPPVAAPAAPPSSTTGGHTLGWIIGGTGVAALAVGAGFGVASLSSYHDANALCPSHKDCFNDALSAQSSANSKAWISNVAFGVGVVGVGIGAWILLTGRRGEPAARVGVRSTPDGKGMRVSVERSF
jgi:tetratricopeptide (TPR) repeat protein